mmetsp:Transcript_6193/g.14714  ORF Transcript_6193/g.14714 Transcript_6193/m.14714 type:complete len:114 (+) Transcript_6193:134-475(+)|eukprot:CAMPEP_0180132766 /NCGR_PEP_ID=MMETSP0986-20121125/9169_1 /TAXON_ID=697907 /ORGANISM="non described non described, Strain CCMP2293" /LENGTH=113 /DNA_ID=CAMNT_0022072813 /DNA_START=47 /DNA_END=388 /DNA_ORIENTATION=+
MFCNSCGASNPDGAAFCSGCGKNPGGGAQAAPQMQNQMQQPVVNNIVMQAAPVQQARSQGSTLVVSSGGDCCQPNPNNYCGPITCLVVLFTGLWCFVCCPLDSRGGAVVVVAR